MSSYQFHYLNREKTLACLMIAQCDTDKDAWEMARSLPGIVHRTFEVWRGDILIHEGFNPHIAN
jgi:hypothetical protein